MNVLIVPSWYKSQESSNLGSFFYEQAQMLQKNGIAVVVANATLQGRSNYRNKDNFKLIKYYDGEVLTYRYTTPSLGLTRIGKLGAYLFKKNLEKIIHAIEKDGIKIDLIHAHATFFGGYVSTILGKEYGIPVVVTEHNSLVLTKSLDEVKRMMLCKTVNSANAFICVSNALKNSVEELTYSSLNEIIPNVVNPIFTYRKAYKKKKFTFISIGNLVPSKRFDMTLEAFARINRTIKNSFLYIVGDGPLLNDLKDNAIRLGIKDDVCFKGRISRNEVFNTICESDVMVLPSDFETFGVVYIEAMACGRPVIATKNGGANEIVNESNGYLIDCGDIDLLEKAMMDSILYYDKFDLPGIADKTLDEYGEANIFNRTIEIYRKVIKPDVMGKIL